MLSFGFFYSKCGVFLQLSQHPTKALHDEQSTKKNVMGELMQELLENQ